MVIGIIGVGFVGGALKSWFKEHTGHDLRLYDPAKGHLDPTDNCAATFICVPVPTTVEGQDYTQLESAIYRASGAIFIRSTVLPGTNDRYGTYSCPEFLSEKTAEKDVERMGILTGGTELGFIQEVFPGKHIIQMSNKECELAKYAHNAMGSIKVNFFNLIYGICRDTGCDYEKVLSGVLMSGHINEAHTRVPGPDKQFGFGGTCFPKDLKALHQAYPRMSFMACLHENEVHRQGPSEPEVETHRDIPSSTPAVTFQ